MRKWWQNFRRNYFPTAEQRRSDGWDAAKALLGENPTEDEVDDLLRSIYEDGDPFNEGIRDYCRGIDYGEANPS